MTMGLVSFVQGFLNRSIALTLQTLLIIQLKTAQLLQHINVMAQTEREPCMLEGEDYI